MSNTNLDRFTNEQLAHVVVTSEHCSARREDALRILFERHAGLLDSTIWSACRAMRASWLYDEAEQDLRQTAYLGLLEAVHKYRLDGGAKFSTFAYGYIRGYLLDYISAEYRIRTRTVSEDALYSVPSVEDIPLHIEVKEAELEVATFVSTLSNRQRDVCRRLYWDGHSQREVGHDLGVSHKMIGKIVGQVRARGAKTFARGIRTN